MAIFTSLWKSGNDPLDLFSIKTNKILYDLSLYDMKQIDSTLPCVCWVIGHRRRQNVVRTSVTHSAAIASCAFFFFLLHFGVICDLLLNRRTATWNLFVSVYSINYFANFLTWAKERPSASRRQSCVWALKDSFCIISLFQLFLFSLLFAVLFLVTSGVMAHFLSNLYDRGWHRLQPNRKYADVLTASVVSGHIRFFLSKPYFLWVNFIISYFLVINV